MIDLSQLPPPNIIETLDYEAILAERKARLIGLYPADEQATVSAQLELESDPRTKLLQENAYRELLLRARINDSARAVMLAYAKGADLDHLVASPPLNLRRLDGESDERLRKRAQLSPEGYSTAGPVQSYIYHALSASPQVRDATVSSPTPGTVRLAILAEPEGTPSAGLLSAVLARVSADDVRPLTDQVEVVAAEIIPYRVVARLLLNPGPDSTVVLAAAEAARAAYVEQQFRLGHDVSISGLHAALHQPGVTRVDLLDPTESLVVAAHQAARCVGVDIAVSGVGL
ncbi:baseplate assembly protein [Azotobacter beijerinckii]|uniref:Phage-related baseplate assembly protein n=1 Tax=Azotobacter beijerinckii TaxID=170623 RepID=A0A1I0ZXU6_9GAMM|nr:baseplate J/gp47 family protein [Azotobacter beijerinckii]SFB30595.1 Phage-related baseplate assembly protein [Azotobacter beijerinckii]